MNSSQAFDEIPLMYALLHTIADHLFTNISGFNGSLVALVWPFKDTGFPELKDQGTLSFLCSYTPILSTLGCSANGCQLVDSFVLSIKAHQLEVCNFRTDAGIELSLRLCKILNSGLRSLGYAMQSTVQNQPGIVMLTSSTMKVSILNLASSKCPSTILYNTGCWGLHISNATMKGIFSSIRSYCIPLQPVCVQQYTFIEHIDGCWWAQEILCEPE